MSPLPEDMYLPGGWSCREFGDGTLAFARDGGRFVVQAERTADGPHPEFDCPYAWSLAYQQRTGVALVGGSIGFVTTKEAAIEGLMACMRRINAVVGSGPGVDLRRTLEDVELHDEVPATIEVERQSPRSGPSDPSNHNHVHGPTDA